MAGMRVRSSPFGTGPPGAPSGAGSAPNPPASHGFADPSLNFDWIESEASPPPGPGPQPAGGYPQQRGAAGFPQQGGYAPQQGGYAPQQGGYAPQQGYGQQQQQQQQQQPSAAAFPSFPQQPQKQPQQPGGGMGFEQQMQQGAAAALASGMGAMGMGGMSAPMANMLFASGANVQSHPAMSWFPSVMFSLQQLFQVGHSFVFRKLLVLLCPFVKPVQDAGAWSVDGSPGAFPGGQRSPAAGNLDGLKTNVEEPDLYIPTMSYITYVLLYGVQRGTLSDFKPEVLSSTFSFALVLFIIEVGCFYMAFYITGAPVPALPLAANCGYKYPLVVLMVLCRIMIGGSNLYYLFFAYLAACAVWATRRFLEGLPNSDMRQQYGVPPSSLTKHIILGAALAQLPICWLLTPSAS